MAEKEEKEKAPSPLFGGLSSSTPHKGTVRAMSAATPGAAVADTREEPPPRVRHCCRRSHRACVMCWRLWRARWRVSPGRSLGGVVPQQAVGGQQQRRFVGLIVRSLDVVATAASAGGSGSGLRIGAAAGESAKACAGVVVDGRVVSAGRRCAAVGEWELEGLFKRRFWFRRLPTALEAQERELEVQAGPS